MINGDILYVQFGLALVIGTASFWYVFRRFELSRFTKFLVIVSGPLLLYLILFEIKPSGMMKYLLETISFSLMVFAAWNKFPGALMFLKKRKSD